MRTLCAILRYLAGDLEAAWLASVWDMHCERAEHSSSFARHVRARPRQCPVSLQSRGLNIAREPT